MITEASTLAGVQHEPGFYLEGAYGIRIENLVVVREAEMESDRNMLCFETLTLCPIDTRCIEPSLLRADGWGDWLRIVRFPESPAVGTPAPDFELALSDGGRLRLEDRRGRIAVFEAIGHDLVHDAVLPREVGEADALADPHGDEQRP